MRTQRPGRNSSSTYEDPLQLASLRKWRTVRIEPGSAGGGGGDATVHASEYELSRLKPWWHPGMSAPSVVSGSPLPAQPRFWKSVALIFKPSSLHWIECTSTDCVHSAGVDAPFLVTRVGRFHQPD